MRKKCAFAYRGLIWTVLICALPVHARRDKATAAQTEKYKIVHVFPHDPSAFTQGLIYKDGFLYEGTGLNGKSSIRKVDLENGITRQRYDLPSQYFGEGITDWGGNLLELTWTSNTCFVYDRKTFRLLRTFHYEGEGWGLTHDDKHLIMSDGTAQLRFIDPESFRELKRVTVTDNGKPIQNLNELEYINGEIFANIWMSDKIAILSPKTGKVLRWLDLSGILPEHNTLAGNAVLNGIAYDASSGRIFVTGKLWPKLFEIKLID
jgi:glutamine cyclotransferase